MHKIKESASQKRRRAKELFGESIERSGWLNDDLPMSRFVDAVIDAALFEMAVIREDAVIDAALDVRGKCYPIIKWQPIDTAPKDGKDILIFNDGLIRIGFFDTARNGVWSVWPGRAIANPTHWMPLPDAPKL